MNRRILTIVSCALVLSVCASYLVYRAVGAKASAVRQPKTTPVLVAARDLEAGILIRDIDLKTAAWSGPVPRGAIAKAESVLDRGVASPIYEGEPITEARLAQQGSGGGLAGIIPAGMRACAVRVNEVVGVAGFVTPGMRVDVLITGLPPDANPLGGPRVRTLLQNIKVLSAGTDFQRDQAGKPEQAQVVNLLVTPAQAEVLSLAGNEMHIQLVLRNPMDTEIAHPPGAMVSDLFSGRRASDSVSIGHPRQATETSTKPTENTQTPARLPAQQAIVVPPASSPYVIDVMNGSAHTEARFSPAEVEK